AAVNAPRASQDESWHAIQLRGGARSASPDHVLEDADLRDVAGDVADGDREVAGDAALAERGARDRDRADLRRAVGDDDGGVADEEEAVGPLARAVVDDDPVPREVDADGEDVRLDRVEDDRVRQRDRAVGVVELEAWAIAAVGGDRTARDPA